MIPAIDSRMPLARISPKVIFCGSVVVVGGWYWSVSSPRSIGEICDLHYLAIGVIGGPFADLFSFLEVA